MPPAVGDRLSPSSIRSSGRYAVAANGCTGQLTIPPGAVVPASSRSSAALSPREALPC